jgi:glycosidase
MLLSALLSFVLPLFSSIPVASAALPNSVTLVGTVQMAKGCAGNWDPACTSTHMVLGDDGVFRISVDLPAGNYEYKVALNDGWTENYGKNAASNGANITLNLSQPTTVKFYYDPNSHWITDNFNTKIVTAAGSFQKALGCLPNPNSDGNWQPYCLRSWLEDIDGDGIYTWETTAIPAGNYEFKIAINEDWTENYGAGGTPNGGNVQLNVPANGAKVKFSFNYATKAISAVSGHGQDNNVEYDGLGHNSQDLLYRQPFGAVNPKTPITLRFRTFVNDVTGVKVRFFDDVTKQEFFQNMTRIARGISCYDPKLSGESCDWWETSYTPSALTTLYYRFIITDGTATAYYDDDKFKDGGFGEATPAMSDNSYVVTVFDPAFKPIPWMQNAVIYQIFPDRFRNGSTKNDPNPVTEPRYGYPSNALDQILFKPWTDLPEGYCQKYKNPASACNELPRGRDYFGGDLAGVTQKLDYLSALGVNVLYFNPIFEAASDHAYDTQDYYKIDHFFGTQQDWNKLVSEAKNRGIRIVLDGVFNHVSSDSPYFDRYGHFAEVGACESLSSPYRDWFFFHPKTGGPCAGPDGPNTMDYDAWFGFDSLPVLNKNNQGVRNWIYASNNSVARTWLKQGAAGWRLDVMGDGSFPADYWQQFRKAVKSTKSDAPIIGELWKKDEMLPKIHGDMADTGMNYRFRNAILGFFGTVDDKGFADDGASDEPPSLFASKLNSIREDYPDAVYYTLMNLMDSHDTQRILWSLTPGNRNRESKEFNAANLEIGKKRLKLATLVQMTTPGAPTVYYGDEVALNGDDDPDDRRTFPWTDLNGPAASDGYYGAGGDHAILDWYRKLTTIRSSNLEITNGEQRFLLLDDTNRTMAYGLREYSQPGLQKEYDQSRITFVAINRNESSAQTLKIPVTGYVRNGAIFKNQLGNETVTVADGFLTITLPALTGAILTAAPGQDLVGPLETALVDATAGDKQVSVSWNAISGATKYNVYRSQLSHGGYQFVATVTSSSYVDSNVINGKRYYYAVRAVDAAGNEGWLSEEAGATPHTPIGYAVLQWPKTITKVKSIDPTENIYGQVYVAGITDANGSTDSILAQVGYGKPGSDPNDWTTWTDMKFNVRSGNNYEYMANLTPEQVGTFDLLVRFSVDNGISWFYGDQDGATPDQDGWNLPGVLKITPNPDTIPPAAPANLRVTNWSSNFITIAWDKVSDGAQYRVYRSTVAGKYDYNNPIAKVDGSTLTYTDNTVGAGTVYYYVVRAYDAALNPSVNSNEVSHKTEPKVVAVTFRVKVPAETPAADTVYLVGSIDALGPWNPGKQPMVNKGNGVWEFTLDILDGTVLDYKYTRGSWEKVEWWGSIVSTANRRVVISYGANGTQLVDNTATDWGNGADDTKAVQAWRDPLVATATGNASNVAVNFAQNIQTGSVANTITVTLNGNAVTGTVAANGSKTLVWTPGAPLGPGTYTVTVNNVKSDLAGDSVPMQAPYTFTFTI